MPDDSNAPGNEQPSGGVAFGMVQADIFRDRSLPSSVKLVYVALATYADARRTAFPSQQTLANDTGLSLSTVKRAIKTGTDAGLFAMVRSQTSNRYQLRDLKFGGYVLGSGPVGHGDTLEGSRGHSGQVTVTHEQDQSHRPAVQTSSTSSDAFAAAGPRASASTDMKIFVPRDFGNWDDPGRITQYLVSSSIAALQHAGYEPSHDAGDRLGRAIRDTIERNPHLDNAALVKAVEDTLQLAGTDAPGWGTLADRKAS